MKCYMCGSEFSGKFCTNCGAKADNNNYGIQEYHPSPDYKIYRSVTESERKSSMGIVKRSITLCILLTILTCGIYGLYWLGTLNDDANKLSSAPASVSGASAVLLTILTCGIYGIFWTYKQGEKLENARIQRNMTSGSLAVLYLVLSILGLGIVSFALMQNEINTIVG